MMTRRSLPAVKYLAVSGFNSAFSRIIYFLSFQIVQVLARTLWRRLPLLSLMAECCSEHSLTSWYPVILVFVLVVLLTLELTGMLARPDVLKRSGFGDLPWLLLDAI
jgi:hypothetical protein